MRINSSLRAVLTILIVSLFSIVTAEFGQSAPLNWEIERNFRYFKYNSDVALQRVASDLFEAQHVHKPDAAELERYLNDPGFWVKKLSTAKHRETWPKAWLDFETPRGLIRELRDTEGSRADVPSSAILERRGWASLLVRQTQSGPDGETDTCWSPLTRKHTNCDNYYGDYARPRGWIVRVFDAAPPAGANCAWRGDGGAYVGQTSEATVHKKGGLHTKTGPWVSPANQDCREARIYVPSNAADPRKVGGSINIFRRVGNDPESPALAVNPQDILIVGFADSFGSGEGNPEGGAQFFEFEPAVPNTILPARRSPDASFPEDRAQWTDRWCHRSVYSWQIKAALQLAQADRQKSVTVLPYGCSGAEVFQGILYSYGGVEPTRTAKKTPPGHSAQLGLAYQELCKTYYESSNAPKIQEEPRWQNDDALRRAAKSGKTIDLGQARKEEVLQYIWKNLTRCERTGPNQFQFKRDVDHVLIAAGINDIGFSRWVTAAISDDQIGPALDGFIPKAGHPETEMRLQRMRFRYEILREALDKRFLVDAGLHSAGANAGAILRRVIVPLYPRGLEDETGEVCARGNQGMTVGTFPRGTDAALRCEKSGFLGFKSRVFSLINVQGPVLAVRKRDDMAAIEAFRENELNAGATKFAAASASRPGYMVISAPNAKKDGNKDGSFAKRGFCATRDPDSAVPNNQCLAFDYFRTAPPPVCDAGLQNCIPRSADSMHVARGLEGKPEWAGIWRPFRVDGKFPPHEYYPYAHRTRLFRTPNDVYMLINNRPSRSLDTNLPGILDLDGRASSGAFHPTAEAHAIIAKMVAEAFSP